MDIDGSTLVICINHWELIYVGQKRPPSSAQRELFNEVADKVDDVLGMLRARHIFTVGIENSSVPNNQHEDSGD